MSSGYFDEHDCLPLAPGEQPDHLAHMARLLVDTGYWNQSEFSAFFSSTPPPPTSEDFINGLEEKIVTNKGEDEDSGRTFKCPICLKESEEGETEAVFTLPCKHQFHVQCLKMWMAKTSTCPICRFELPTKDEAYEEMRKQKKREEQKKRDIENLHDAMYG